MEVFEVTQVFVAGDDHIGLSSERGGQHNVVVRVGGNGAGEGCRFDDVG